MTQHTPGPWRLEGLMVNSHAMPGGSVCLMSNCDSFGELSQAPNFEANARLIAAAPVMLDALKDALCSLEISCQSDYVTGRVRAAIAAAEGRT